MKNDENKKQTNPRNVAKHNKNRSMTTDNDVSIIYVFPYTFLISTIDFNFVLNFQLYSHVTKTENKVFNVSIENKWKNYQSGANESRFYLFSLK